LSLFETAAAARERQTAAKCPVETPGYWFLFLPRQAGSQDGFVAASDPAASYAADPCIRMNTDAGIIVAFAGF
jgi:hypothetical protein